MYVVTKTVPKFLSRLCGGEHFEDARAKIQAFLSRLCGGELTGEFCAVGFEFLSRLCGGERIDTQDA